MDKLDNTELNGRRIRLVEDRRRGGRHSRSSSSRSRSRSRRRSRSRSRYDINFLHFVCGLRFDVTVSNSFIGLAAVVQAVLVLVPILRRDLKANRLHQNHAPVQSKTIFQSLIHLHLLNLSIDGPNIYSLVGNTLLPLYFNFV